MASSTASGSLYLIDAHSLIYQVFHAIPAMSSPTGLPTNALFGFTRDLLFLRNEKKPDYLIVAFDEPGPTFRDHIYPEYKANRSAMPDDLQPQLPLIARLMEAMRIPRVGLAGYEADDILATIAREAADRNLNVYLCTTDKDCRQLITDRTCLYNLRKHKVMDKAALQEDWGIKPEQVVDFQTLVGDSVDNVKGVVGIGEKTAAKLLQEFGTLDNLMAHIDQVPGAKKQENLRAAVPIIPVTRQLVELDSHVPITMDWEGWRVQPWDAQQLLVLFQEWGFRSFAEQVRNLSGLRGPLPVVKPQPKPLPASPKGGQAELFPFGYNTGEEQADGQQAHTNHEHQPPAEWKATYHLVDTEEKFSDFLKELRKQKRFAFDLETTSLQPLEADIIGWAITWKSGEAWYLAVRGPEGAPTLDPTDTLEALRPIFEDPTVAKVNQNIKYDLLVLRQHGLNVAGVAGDSMVADYLLHAGERSHGLDELARRYLGHAKVPIAELIGKKTKSSDEIRMDRAPTDKIAQYAGKDADVAWRLCELLEPELGQENLKKLYDDLEVPLIDVLAELEFNGIRLDLPFLKKLSGEMEAQLAGIEAEIYRLAGREFNIASPKQLRDVLFKDLNLPKQRRTGITGEASTAQETLDKLAALGHELPRKIVEHRQIAKLKGTYVDALPALVNKETGRVHASFNQTVAATGRLSGSDPNLQNIPIRTDQGRQIRQAFLPEEGWHLITADYSQIELRLLAHLSRDKSMRQAFADDHDIHALVAAQIFGVSEADVTEAMRRIAKTVNFGIIYGMSPHGLAARLGIPREEAARFIDAYFARYPKVLDYQTKLLANCRKTGYVNTILGRRRAISGIRERSNYQQRNQPEREAVNMEIQGSAADLIKLAMLGIHRRLKTEHLRTRMLLQIHDELVFEAPPDELETAISLVQEEMTTPLERALHIKVPIKVDMGAGANWLDVEDVACLV
jgi:DNA polymerase-1